MLNITETILMTEMFDLLDFGFDDRFFALYVVTLLLAPPPPCRLYFLCLVL